jgi:hypothetical protein
LLSSFTASSRFLFFFGYVVNTTESGGLGGKFCTVFALGVASVAIFV